MHLQVLSSGSRGNSTLLRAGDLHVLVDAGLTARLQRERLEAAKLPYNALEHILVTHGHLDHSRSAGILAKRQRAVVHCPEAMMSNRSVARAPQLATLRVDGEAELVGKHGDRVEYRAVRLPHDCDPTVAFRIDHKGRVAVVLTDMGAPDDTVARRLTGAHVLVLEFNHDADMLANGADSPALKRRIAGDRGHLSNAQAQRMLARLAGPELHTLVLAHLSQRNNTPALAEAAAREALDAVGCGHVRVLVASQDEIGPNLEV